MSDKKDLMWRAYLVYIGFFHCLDCGGCENNHDTV